MEASIPPIEEIAKLGTSGLGGAGLFGLMMRFMRGDVKRIEAKQSSDKTELLNKITSVEMEIHSHTLFDAQTYATREDMKDLRNHIDTQFSEQRNFLVSLIKDIK